MDYYNSILLLIDSKKVYGGDRLTVKSESFFDLNVKKYEDQNDLYKLIPTIIKNIGARRNFSIDDRNINDSNREYYFESYFILYKKVSDYYNRKSAGNKGRNKQHVSSILLKEIRNQYVHGIITIDEAVKRSGLGSK